MGPTSPLLGGSTECDYNGMVSQSLAPSLEDLINAIVNPLSRRFCCVLIQMLRNKSTYRPKFPTFTATLQISQYIRSHNPTHRNVGPDGFSAGIGKRGN
jgi:hypothetical protein